MGITGDLDKALCIEAESGIPLPLQSSQYKITLNAYQPPLIILCYMLVLLTHIYTTGDDTYL